MSVIGLCKAQTYCLVLVRPVGRTHVNQKGNKQDQDAGTCRTPQIMRAALKWVAAGSVAYPFLLQSRMG